MMFYVVSTFCYLVYIFSVHGTVGIIDVSSIYLPAVVWCAIINLLVNNCFAELRAMLYVCMYVCMYGHHI